MTHSALLAQLGYGVLLGWSVAWPPGPINAEAVRRTLAGGFWAGYALSLGACTGDALWALATALGAGFVPAGGRAQAALAALSTGLLGLLAVFFLRGAWQAALAFRSGAPPHAPGRFESGRAGLLLGLGMALSSPWNLAFWLAVMGRAEIVRVGVGAALVVALAVIVGAAAWGAILSSLVVLLRLQFAGAVWEIVAKGLTGLLMLYFAGRGLWRLVTG